jgi:hypothetical protein
MDENFLKETTKKNIEAAILMMELQAGSEQPAAQAKLMRKFFDSFKAVGFSDEQSLKMTLALMGSSAKGGE